MTLPRKATIVASVTAFVLAGVKLVVGAMTGSMSVIASAVDSLLDMLMSLFNMYAVKNSEREADEAYNYGRGKIEGLASLVEGSLIALSALFIIYQSVSNLFESKEVIDLDVALWAMIGSTAVTLLLVIFLNRVARATNSLVIRSDALHYRSDLMVNVGIIVSLALIVTTNWHWIDSAVSIVIAFVIIVSGYNVAKDGVFMLLDHALDSEVTEKIDRILQDEKRISNYHYLRTRKSANMLLVDVHLVFDEHILLKEAHAISDEIEAKIKEIDRQSKWIITIHLDPKDDSSKERRF